MGPVTFVYSVEIAAPVEKVFHFHDDAENILRVVRFDRWKKVELKLVRVHGDPGVGRLFHFRLTHRRAIAYELRLRILEYDPPRRIVFEMKSDFFRVCRNTIVCEETPRGTRLTDNLDLQPMAIDPVWILRNWLFGPPDLYILEERRRLTREILETEHRRASGKGF